MLCVAAATAALVKAQTLGELRAQLRSDLRDIQFAKSLIGLVLLTDELELSGASYSFDDESNTDLTVFALPFHSVETPWGRGNPRLHIEGTLGFGEAQQSAADLFRGALPGLEAGVASKWRSYGGLLGAGIEWPVAKDFSITPLVDIGLSRIENHTKYSGPGAAFAAGIADGIAFNWDAIAVNYGGAIRTDWRHQLTPKLVLQMTGRYDVRWTEMIEVDDAAQEFATRAQLVTLRGDVTGPTGVHWLGQSVDWQAGLAYRMFPEGSLFGVDEYLQVGGSLLFHTGDRMPVGKGFAIGGALMHGEDFRGWTVGLRVLF
jgi:hypothetical protein